MKYKLINHPYKVIDFSNFEDKDPFVFADHMLNLINENIRSTSYSDQNSIKKNLLFVDIVSGECPFGECYALEEKLEVDKDIYYDMLDFHHDLLELSDDD